MSKLRSPSDIKAGLIGTDEPVRLSPITTIEIDETMNGVRYQGTFTYKVPTIGDSIMIGQMKNKYLPDGSKADQQSALLVEQICYLEITLQNPRPAWWAPLDFVEGDILAKLYSEALAYANRFLGRDKVNGSTVSVDESSGSGGDDLGDEGDLEQDVPGANERPKTIISHVSRAK